MTGNFLLYLNINHTFISSKTIFNYLKKLLYDI